MNEVAEVVRIKFAKLTVLAVVDIISLGPVLVDVLSSSSPPLLPPRRSSITPRSSPPTTTSSPPAASPPPEDNVSSSYRPSMTIVANPELFSHAQSLKEMLPCG